MGVCWMVDIVLEDGFSFWRKSCKDFLFRREYRN